MAPEPAAHRSARPPGDFRNPEDPKALVVRSIRLAAPWNRFHCAPASPPARLAGQPNVLIPVLLQPVVGPAARRRLASWFTVGDMLPDPRAVAGLQLAPCTSFGPGMDAAFATSDSDAHLAVRFSWQRALRPAASPCVRHRHALRLSSPVFDRSFRLRPRFHPESLLYGLRLLRPSDAEAPLEFSAAPPKRSDQAGVVSRERSLSFACARCS